MTGIHPSDERLNDYADGLLTAPEREEVDRHLAICNVCSEQIHELESLLVGLDSLPRAIPPGVDLRPGIHARISAGPAGAARDPFTRRAMLWSVRYQLAAAAVILVALSSMVTLFLSQDAGWPDRPATVAVAAGPAEGDVALAEFRLLEAEYVRAAGELRSALEHRDGAMDRSTAELLERNLRVIDEAIRESRAALAADPHSEMLRQVILSTYERKLEILRRAETLRASS